MVDDNPIERRLEALYRENAELRVELEESGARAAGRTRSVISWILVVLAIFAVLAGVHAAWLQTTIADEDQFVDTFAPLPENEAVAAVLSNRIATLLVIDGGVSDVIAENLPSDLAFLAVPVAEGIREVSANIANELILSDVFAGIWREALRVAHNGASLVLSTDGKVSIDLNEAAAEVVSELEARGLTLLSDVEVELPEIVIFQNDQLETASAALKLIDTLGWLLPVLAIVLIAAAIWVSPNRRRTTAAIGFGTALLLLLVLVIVRLVRANTVAAIDSDPERMAAEATWDTTLRFYRQGLWALIVLGLIIGAVAWIFSDSPRAVRARIWWADLLERRRGPDATVPTTGFAGFIAAWKRPLQWGVVVAALLFLLVVSTVSAGLVVLTAVIVAALIAWLELVGGPAPVEEVYVLEVEEETVGILVEDD